MRSPIKSRAGRKKRGEHSFLNGCSFRGAGIIATEIKIGARHEVLNAFSFLASPLAALLGHTHIVRSLTLCLSFFLSFLSTYLFSRLCTFTSSRAHIHRSTSLHLHTSAHLYRTCTSTLSLLHVHPLFLSFYISFLFIF